MNHLAKTKKNHKLQSKGIITKGATATYTLIPCMFREDLEDLFVAIQSTKTDICKCIDFVFLSFYRPIKEKDN